MYEYQLKADALKSGHNEQDTESLTQAGIFLREEKVPRLVSLLNSLTVMPMDSEQLQNIFHMQGVNMRYLGQVAR